MKRFVTTIALTLALGSVAFAGDVPSVGINATEPDETRATTADTTAPGEIPSVGYTGDISNPMLNLIHLMMGVIV